MTRKESFNLQRFAKELGVPPFVDASETFAVAIEQVKRRRGDLVELAKRDFDALLQEIEKEAEALYFKAEQQFAKNVIRSFVAQKKPATTSEIDFLMDNERILAGIYMSLIQGRKNRAGKTLERILSFLFESSGYPFSYQPKGIDGRPDYIMPSLEYYQKSALNSLVFTSKRVLRERWRQIVTEGMRGIGFYLGTIDEELTKPELKQMADHRIFVVCPKSIKEKFYADESNVLNYEQFFAEHLEPKAKIWKREKIM
jgi:hypothetical protein